MRTQERQLDGTGRALAILRRDREIAYERAVDQLKRLSREVDKALEGIEKWENGESGFPTLDVATAARAAEATALYESAAQKHALVQGEVSETE